MLVLAREEAGYTQAELASFLGITQGNLSKLESGLISLTEELESRLVGVLDKPADLFRYEGPIEMPTFVLFRKRATIEASLRKQVWARLTLETIRVRQLLSGTELDTGQLPFFDPDECRGGEVEIAQRMRRMWKLPPGPAKNIIRLVENAGVLVIRFDFGTRKVDGCSGVVGDVPVIFINTGLTAARQRLTVAHELGHLIMHRYASEETEEQAFVFAAEFLMPKDEILPMLAPLSLEKLVRLKLHWGVSMQAILKRAEGLGAISPSGARYYWARMGQAGYRHTEPYDNEIPAEPPTLLPEVIDTYLNDLKYTREELAKLVLLTPRQLDCARWGGAQIRVVK